ncbi:MAG: 50S ribosomal protein L17 [Acholeplasmatales bacterium]|jgi:large subunit ribosomal protein L17|nr:50S ribosomal protein L17 [Acholeplasmataceae bacterium]MDY0115376.1 50S ribosomal protein L17 [Acholeplasmatales bacterium]MCK9234191.1 50S ribosomal protein L17 [Acholeplasmataceae bacterium]MCK9288850.1 50S ribosomal protein L17 [Acholeplasmataceae bacterium]MCK9427244.1 50S ribosomal protein L17 [Acholeplasmataceae bacterium]
MAYSRLRRTTAQKKALMRDLVTQLIIHEQITTTESKAKELKKLADKMVTLAKKGTLHARRQAAKTVRPQQATETKTALQKLFDDLADRYQERNGGYTAVYKTMPRLGDNAPMAIIQFIND